MTHFKRLLDKDYLGAHDLELNKDYTLTIKDIKVTTITNDKGSKQKGVIHWAEKFKPMILTGPNGMKIAELYKANDYENWIGKQVTLYVNQNEKHFGKLMDVVRVRNYVGKPEIVKVRIELGSDNYNKLLEWMKSNPANTIKKAEVNYDIADDAYIELTNQMDIFNQANNAK